MKRSVSAVSLLLDRTILEGRHPALLVAPLPDTDGVTREGRLDKGVNSLAPPLDGERLLASQPP